MAKSKVGIALANARAAQEAHKNAAPHAKYYTKMNKEAHEFIHARKAKGAKLKVIARAKKDNYNKGFTKGLTESRRGKSLRSV